MFGHHNVVRAQGGKPKRPKAHPRPADKRPERIGGRGEHSQESVLEWIQARKPPPVPVESQRLDQGPSASPPQELPTAPVRVEPSEAPPLR